MKKISRIQKILIVGVTLFEASIGALAADSPDYSGVEILKFFKEGTYIGQNSAHKPCRIDVDRYQFDTESVTIRIYEGDENTVTGPDNQISFNGESGNQLISLKDEWNKLEVELRTIPNDEYSGERKQLLKINASRGISVQIESARKFLWFWTENKSLNCMWEP